MTKKIVITYGCWGVGKTYFANKFIEKNPNYKLLSADLDIDKLIEEIKQHKYVILDYYFNQDYNAEKLKLAFPDIVKIWIIFDTPEIITHRQINHKPMGFNINCWVSHDTYIKGINELIDINDCVYVDSNMVQHSLEAFKRKLFEHWIAYKKPQVKEFLEKIELIEGYDKHYQAINLPFGFKVGKDGYSKNEETWEYIKPLIEWGGKRILDLCCFHGYFCQQIFREGAYPTGVERHKDAIYSAAVFAKMNNTRYDLYHMDLDLMWPDGKYDAVLLLNSLHHIKEQEELLRRISQIPQSIFEINHEDKSKVMKYVNIVKEINSEKGRLILLCEKK